MKAKTSLKLLAEWVAVKFEKAEEKTSEGIYIPENRQSQPSRGVVVAVGIGRLLRKGGGKLSTPPVRVGDKVVTTKLNWRPLLHNGEIIYISEWDNLLAVDA